MSVEVSFCVITVLNRGYNPPHLAYTEQIHYLFIFHTVSEKF